MILRKDTTHTHFTNTIHKHTHTCARTYTLERAHIDKLAHLHVQPTFWLSQNSIDCTASRVKSSTTNDHKLHGIHTYHLQSLRACQRACARASVIKRSLIFERIVFKFVGDITQIPLGYMSYCICVWMHVLTARTCLHLRICLARDGQWLVFLKQAFVRRFFITVCMCPSTLAPIGHHICMFLSDDVYVVMPICCIYFGNTWIELNWFYSGTGIEVATTYT
jgi:hypothetical protein